MCWPSLGEFAADLNVSYESAKAMKRRGSIAVQHWPALIESAVQRGIHGINAERLVGLHAGPDHGAALPASEAAA